MIDYQPRINYNDNVTGNKAPKAPATEVKMQYTIGDQLLYKGYKGIYCTIVNDKPTETKTIDFRFVDCTDIDGNHYAVVHIGSQTWMSENLKTTKYRNNDAINTTSPAEKYITGESEPKYQWTYSSDENIAAKYCRLNTWYVVTDNRNIAPTCLHMSSNKERTTLQNYLIANGYNYDATKTDNKIAKSLASTTDWSPSTNIGAIGNDLTKNNSSGFTALPVGCRYTDGEFSNIGGYGTDWCASMDVEEYYAWYRDLFYTNYSIVRGSDLKCNGYSISCEKD